MPRRGHFNPASSPMLSAEVLADFPTHDTIGAYLDASDNTYESSDADAMRPSSGERNPPQREVRKNTFHRDKHAQKGQPYVILYHVTCSRRGSHESHQKQVVYLDHPRLFKGDSKMSALRGHKQIEDISKYLKGQNKLIFVVNKRFDCTEYLNAVKKLFHPITPPKDPELPAWVQPYFSVLQNDGPLAETTSETMELISESLHYALAETTGMSHGDLSSLDKSKNMIMLRHLLYYISRLEERLSALTHDQRRLLNVLLEYMESTNKEEYEEVDDLLAQGLITEAYLPRLFGPKQFLLASMDGHTRAYMLEEAPLSTRPISLELWSWQFDGVFSKAKKAWNLEWPSSVPNDQPIQISNLEIYPLKYASSDVVKRLRARGHIFWKCRLPRLVAYDSPNAILETHMNNRRYMIDANTYRRMHGASPSEQDHLGVEAMENEEPPDSSFVLLLPHEIQGFGMHDKKWRTLLVEHIKEINWNEGAFDRLVMHHGKKELIQALVTVHTQSTRSTDIIEGKGNALIMLLHGGPGTGKTLTAESVAELTRKPLYRVTCGDIGTNAEEVEKYLESVLLIGTIWGCVVLLDEADVFLEERRETDLQRNALVSVFLRVLEYYNGILILTSNRIGTFDSAFKSRFQLAVHYPTLDFQGRYEIWLNFINGLSKTNPDVKIDDLKCRIQDLAAVELNGRQIRNTVSTSLQLAHFRQTTLSYEHFKQVIGVAEEFEKHIESTRGYSDLDWARDRGIRPE